jgi:hypothetical protein
MHVVDRLYAYGLLTEISSELGQPLAGRFQDMLRELRVPVRGDFEESAAICFAKACTVRVLESFRPV